MSFSESDQTFSSESFGNFELYDQIIQKGFSKKHKIKNSSIVNIGLCVLFKLLNNQLSGQSVEVVHYQSSPDKVNCNLLSHLC